MGLGAGGAVKLGEREAVVSRRTHGRSGCLKWLHVSPEGELLPCTVIAQGPPLPSPTISVASVSPSAREQIITSIQ